MENTQLERKPMKIGKRPGTAYCLGCKDFTRNFRSQEFKMTNELLREKPNCVVCRYKKSRFIKQKHTNKE